MAFTKATKSRAKLRLALIGPSGCGKTYTALTLATAIGGPVAVIDTEHGSASKYADLFGFDVLEPDSFAPAVYVRAIQEAEAAGYNVLVIDSLSHAWMGKDGALEQVDRAAKRSPSGNSYVAWRDVTPQHNALVEAMIACRMHLIVTMRAKMEYEQVKDDKGKTTIRKVGLAPIQRDGLEYEFDVVGDMTQDNTLMVSKTRCPVLNGAIIERPDANLAKVLLKWLDDGAEPVEKPKATTPPPTPATTQAPTNGGNGVSRTIAKIAAPGVNSVAYEHADALIPPITQSTPPPPQGDKKDGEGEKEQDVIFKSSRYGAEVRTFVNTCPYYQDAKGNVDGFHIKGTLRKLNIFTVTNENIDAVWTALRQYAEDKEAVKDAPEPAAETAPLFDGEA